ncbi:MAG: hypothetical protein R3B72_36155 [Polyangiaceae bacterium]
MLPPLRHVSRLVAIGFASGLLAGCPDFLQGRPIGPGGSGPGGSGTGGATGGGAAAGGNAGASGPGGAGGDGGAAPQYDGPPLEPSGQGDSLAFGAAVAIDESTGIPTLLVGAHREDATASGSGAAYVFVRGPNGWAEQQKLTPDDAAAGDSFGEGVALHGDTAVVGAPGAEAAYVFVRSGTTWSQQAKLSTQDTGAWHPGDRVALHGDVAIVSDTLYFVPGTGKVGAAYVFVRNGDQWSEETTLLGLDGADGDNFAWSLAFDGVTLVAGVPFSDGPSVDAGSAMVFRRSGSQWTGPTKLLPPTSYNDDQFGFAVAVDGDTLVVGESRRDVAGTSSGAAHVFHRDGGGAWSHQAMLAPRSGAALDYFGQGVAIRGDLVAGGAPGVDGLTDVNLGAAYLFERSSSTWSATLTFAPDGPTEEDLGRAVTASASYLAIGAPRGRGKVYVWRAE